MTVRELIEHLQTLDQDKGIWVRYDGFFYFSPEPDDVAGDEDKRNGKKEGVKKGDYIINAG
jgi:hypothetical protein